MARFSVKRIFGRIGSGLYGYVSSMHESISTAFINDADGGAASRRRILYGNIFANMIAIMTTGAFFTGLILILLQDEPESVRNSYVGTITLIQTACGLLQIFAPIVIERMRVRKYFVISARLIYYFINVVLLALVPLLPTDGRTKANVFIALIVMMQASVSLSNPALTVWHFGNLPDNCRTDYFSIQSMALPTVNAILAVICGAFVDHFKADGRELVGILLLRAFAVIIVLAESRCFWKVREPDYPHSQNGMTLRSIFATPFRSRAFLSMVLVSVIWSFACNIAGPYFNIYLLEDVKVSYTFINFVSVFNIPILLITMPIWNRIIKRIGWLPMLLIGVSAFALTQLGNLFISERTPWMYPVCCIVWDFISPGSTIAFANLPYLKIPEESQSSCLAFYATAGSLASLGGVYFGKSFMAATEGIYIDFLGFHMKNYIYVYVIVFGILAVLCAYIIVLQLLEKRRLRRGAAA